MYQKLLKEGNGDHKYLRCRYLQYKNFEVMSSAIALDKIDLDCAENVKAKPTGDYSGFITYSNTMIFCGKLLYNSGYIITQ